MYDLLTSIKYIVDTEGCIIPDVKNVNKTWKRCRRGAWGVKCTYHGGNRVLMLTDNDKGAISKKKCTNVHMEQRKCSLSYHSSSFILMI